MPIVQITLVEGRDEALVKQCIKAVAHAVHETLDAPLASIRVVVNAVPPSHWAVGDVTKDEQAAQAKAAK